MAINPISSSFPFDPLLGSASQPSEGPAAATVASSAAANPNAQLQQEITNLQAANYDDPLLDDLNAEDAAATTNSMVVASFSSMLGAGSSTGDPLLDDLNALDSAPTAGSGASQQSQDTTLNQQLQTLLMQQAASLYSNGQQLGNSQLPGGSATNGSAG